MRKTLTILLIVTSSLTFGQNYKLFTASSKKLFTDYPNPQHAYNFSIDFVQASGNDSIYYYTPYLSDVPDFDSICAYNGGMWQECNKQNVPSWIGKKIIYDNIANYQFFNLTGDTLTFDFATNINDTSVFYKDLSQKFLFIYKKSDTMSVLNHNDSARYYTIIHTDLNGNIVSSALNQQSIIITKNWGMVQFFQIDSFPQILKPIVLIGSVSPTAGFYKLTNEMLYDYQPGDEIQYHKMFSQYNGPPWNNYNKYEKYTILNRTITADSLIYYAIHELFHTDSTQLYTDTIQLKYYRHQVIAIIPFDKYNGMDRGLKLDDYCSLQMWTYNTLSDCDYIGYCASDTCWCCNSEPGPPSTIKYKYVDGLGMYFYNQYLPSYPPIIYGYSTVSEIVYFKKDGISCGSEMFAGIKEYQDKNHKLIISPNPTKGYIHITSSVSLKNIALFNPEGQILLSKNLSGTSETIDIRQLNKGICFARIFFNDNTVTAKKIIILND